MARRAKLIDAGRKGVDPPYPIVQAEPSADGEHVRIKAIIPQERFKRLYLPVPPLDRIEGTPGKPSRYIDYAIARDAYDKLPEGAFTWDDDGNIFVTPDP